MNPDYLRYWPLHPDITYLNHGSLGACPWPVLRAQNEWRARLERGPVRFMDTEMEAYLDEARGRLAEFVGADADDLAFVTNATAGVNTVLKSLEFEPEDEILTDDHEYNACLNALRHVAQRSGARPVIARVPLPVESEEAVIESLLEGVTPRTRLAVISHVSSPTGIVFPVTRIVAALVERGIDTLVDGAHAPGMLPVDIEALGAAYYTGNCHKWMCAPKGSGFLHVRRDRQPLIHPLATSHGANSPRRDRSRFSLEFDWTGTADPTPFLAVGTALEFMAGLLRGGWPEIMRRNREMALAAREVLIGVLGTGELAPAEMLGSLAAVELPPGIAPDPGKPVGAADAEFTHPLDPLHDALYAEERIEVPVYPWPHTAAEGEARRLLRVSAQIYNAPDDYVMLADALRTRMAA